jgi:hypothetical protein
MKRLALSRHRPGSETFGELQYRSVSADYNFCDADRGDPADQRLYSFQSAFFQIRKPAKAYAYARCEYVGRPGHRGFLETALIVDRGLPERRTATVPILSLARQ